MQLNEFCKEFHEEMKQAGFWDAYHNSMDVLQVELRDAVHDAFVAQKIALIMSEFYEALEAMRRGDYGVGRKDTFEDEIADALLRTFDLCGMLNINIDEQLRWKREFNKSREKLHGKEF